LPCVKCGDPKAPRLRTKGVNLRPCLPWWQAGAVWAAGLLALVPAAHAQPVGEWDFVVRLDGKPVGTHRFTLAREGADGLALTSTALFEVKLLGFTAYRYRHEARERWDGNCLAALDASTDDDGRRTQVRGRRGPTGFGLEVSADGVPEAPERGGNCIMSFAYWNTALATQQRLLDPGTGRFVPVQVMPLPATEIDAPRGRVVARGWRIAGLPQPIDVWYDGERWAGLDTTVQGGRRLTYRLR
jgi:hypothetical protein